MATRTRCGNRTCTRCSSSGISTMRDGSPKWSHNRTRRKLALEAVSRRCESIVSIACSAAGRSPATSATEKRCRNSSNDGTRSTSRGAGRASANSLAVRNRVTMLCKTAGSRRVRQRRYPEGESVSRSGFPLDPLGTNAPRGSSQPTLGKSQARKSRYAARNDSPSRDRVIQAMSALLAGKKGSDAACPAASLQSHPTADAIPLARDLRWAGEDWPTSPASSSAVNGQGRLLRTALS